MKDFISRHHVLGRFWIGFGVGVIIGDLISILISMATGGEMVFVPRLEEFCASEAGAFLCQFLMCGLIGTVFAEAGILFAMERWSFPVTCLLHFGCTAIFYLPFLWICNFGMTIFPGILIVLGNILLTYFITWMTSYFVMRAEVERINREIQRLRGDGDGSHSN